MSYKDVVLQDTPLGYWRLGEGAGTSAVDTSGRTGDMGIPGGVPSYPNKAAAFNGINGSVQIAFNAAWNAANFSVEAWVRVWNNSTGQQILCRDDGTNRRWQFRLGAGGGVEFIRIRAGVAVTCAGATSVADGNWHHVVGTYDGTNLRVYVDGALDGGPTAATAPDAPAAGSMWIGARNNGAGSLFFRGMIDEVAFYPSALTATQVSNHFAGGSGYATTITGDGVTGYWHLDETSGTSAADASGNGRTGTYTNVSNSEAGTYTGGFTLAQTSLVPGETDTAVLLNGTTGFIDATRIGLWLVQNMTVEAWIKTNASGVTQAIVTRDIGGIGAGRAFQLLVQTTGTVACFIWPQTGGGTGAALSVVSTAVVNDGLAHHIVLTVSGRTASIYIDGTLDNSGTAGFDLRGLWDPNPKLFIGAVNGASTSNFFNGTLDEIAYYDYALTAARIAQHFVRAKQPQPHHVPRPDPHRARPRPRPVILVRPTPDTPRPAIRPRAARPDPHRQARARAHPIVVLTRPAAAAVVAEDGYWDMLL